jgi:hypothetical protein
MHQYRVSFVTVSVGIGAWLALSTGPLHAQARLDAATSTCAALQANMQRLQSAVVTTGPYLFDRYVASQTWCGLRRNAVPVYVATRDQSQCFLGYRCEQSNN